MSDKVYVRPHYKRKRVRKFDGKTFEVLPTKGFLTKESAKEFAKSINLGSFCYYRIVKEPENYYNIYIRKKPKSEWKKWV